MKTLLVFLVFFSITFLPGYTLLWRHGRTYNHGVARIVLVALLESTLILFGWQIFFDPNYDIAITFPITITSGVIAAFFILWPNFNFSGKLSKFLRRISVAISLFTIMYVGVCKPFSLEEEKSNNPISMDEAIIAIHIDRMTIE